MKYLKSPTTRAAALATLLLAALAPASYGQNLLTNGDFELGPPKAYNYNLSNYAGGGWDRLFDASQWNMVTRYPAVPTDPNNPDNPPGPYAPAGSNSNPSWTPQGNFAVRRTLYGGQAVGEAFMNSIRYQISSFNGAVSVGDTMELSLLGRGNSQPGRFEVLGRITFYDASNQAIASFETNRTTHTAGVSNWEELSAIFVVPDEAVSFMVAGIIDVNTALSSYAYAGFDDFKLQVVVPEPGTVAMVVAAAAAGLVLLRRRKRA